MFGIHHNVFPQLRDFPSPPSKEPLFTVAAFERSIFERFHVFVHVVLRVAGVCSSAVFAIPYATGMVLVAAVRTGKQSRVGAGSFAMALRTFWWIVLWERRGDAEWLVAAGWTTFACVGGRAAVGLAFVVLLALLALVCERRIGIGAVLVRGRCGTRGTAQRRAVDVHGRLAVLVLGRVAMAGERCVSVFLSVCEVVVSVAGEDGIVLCLSEVQSV